MLILFPVFFILGYATYACLYAAIGAMVNSDEEAQQLQFPVTLPLILCMIFASCHHSRSQHAACLLALDVPADLADHHVCAGLGEHAAGLADCGFDGISLASLYGLVWLTSRIYRVGILMYGKRPTLPEILKWIRYA